MLFLQAEDSSLAASYEHLMPLEGSEHTSNTLAVDIMEATSANQMTHEVIALADTISSCITSLYKTQHNYGNHHSHPRPSEETPLPTSAPYIKQAYSWLMQNLSNPYPLKEVREAIARKAGSDPKHVENWFGDARKRMGWNGIRKRHFSNKRHSTVAAATAFFGGQFSELLTDSVRHDFAIMSADAEGMYSHKFTESKFARRIASFTGSPSEERSQSASIEGESSSSLDCSLFHPSLPRTQCITRKRFRSLDSTDNVPDTNNPKKCRRLSCSSESASLHSLPPTTSSRSPVLHGIAATSQMNCQISEVEDHLSLRHLSGDSRPVSLQTVSDLIRTSRNPSPSPSILRSDVSDEPITSQPIPNEATMRSDSVSMASFQQSHTLHSSALSFPHDILPLSLSSTEENTQFPIQLQGPLPWPDSAVIQGSNSALPTSDVTHDTLFSGLTVDDRLLSMSFAEYASRNVSLTQDTNVTSWPATIANTQTDGQFFGYFDSPHTEPILTTQVDALPAFADVDLTFGDLFDLDASTAFPPSDPDSDSMFPLNGAQILTANDSLTLSPAIESPVAQLIQLEQLKKHRSRIQDCIDSLERQISRTLAT